MADLLTNKLLHSLSCNSSRSPSFSFPLTGPAHLNFCIIRFAPLRRGRLSHSSSVLANLSPDPTKLDVISTTEQSDGSVVFKFGDASENAQCVENVDGSVVQSEVIGVLDDEYGVNHTKSEVVGTLCGEHEVELEKQSVNDKELSNVTEVVSSTDIKEDEIHNIEVEGSTESEVDENGDTEVENFTESKTEHQETVLEPFTQEGELVVSSDSVTVLQCGDQCDGDCVEEEQNHNLISTVQTENPGDSEMAGQDVEADIFATISDDVVDLVMENSSDCELVKHGVGIEWVTEKFMEKSDGELMPAVSTSQFKLTGSGLLEISDESSHVKASELAASLKDSEIGNNVQHVVDEEDDNNRVDITQTNSPVEASDMTASLEDKKLDSYAKHVGQEEDDVSDMSEAAETSSPIEASDIAVSLGYDQLDSNVKHLKNEEDDDNQLQEVAAVNSLFDASDMEVSMDDDEPDSKVKQAANEEDGDGKLQKIADVDLLVQTSMVVSLEDDELYGNMKQTANEEEGDAKMPKIKDMDSLVEASNVGVYLEDDEICSSVTQVANKEDGDDKLQKIADLDSVLEALDKAVSLKDDELIRNEKQVANEENGDEKLQKIADRDLPVEASDMTVSLEDDELDRNVKQVANEEDVDGKLQKIADMDLPFQASDMTVSLEDGELDRNAKQAANEEDGDGKLQKIVDMDKLVEASDMALSLGDSELDNNEKHLVNEGDDWGRLMEKRARLEAEQILHEETSCVLLDDVVAFRSASSPDMVDDANAAPPIISLSDDDVFGGDSLEAASPEESGISLAKANVDSLHSAENTMPTLYLSSAAASLPHPGEALTGGKDAYFICQNWLGVADGVGQWSFGGTDRGIYAQELMQNCEKLAVNSQGAELTDIKEFLQQIAAVTESSGSARVLIAHFANQTLHVANIGDTGFVIIRNGAIFKKSSPMVHEFCFPYAIGSGVARVEAAEEYHIGLENGDVIIAATDGLFDNLYEQEIASVVSKSACAGMEPKELAELLVTKAQEVGSLAYGRSPFADAAQAAGHTGIIGGKLDHVTVIVSLVESK